MARNALHGPKCSACVVSICRGPFLSVSIILAWSKFCEIGVSIRVYPCLFLPRVYFRVYFLQSCLRISIFVSIRVYCYRFHVYF